MRARVCRVGWLSCPHPNCLPTPYSLVEKAQAKVTAAEKAYQAAAKAENDIAKSTQELIHQIEDACMTQAGYPGWRNPRHVDRALFDEFLGIQDADPTLDLLAEWDWEAEPDGPPPFERDTASLREREMALALADIDCREALDFDARQREIVLVLEQEFVDRNRDELEAWASAAEALRAGRTP